MSWGQPMSKEKGSTGSSAAAGRAGDNGLAGAHEGSLRYAVWRWERITVWPMLVLSLVFVTLQLLWLFHRNEMSSQDRTFVFTSMMVLWGLFFLDFGTRFVISKDKKLFVKRRWMELVVLFVPLLRPVLPLYYLWRTPFFMEASPKAVRLRYQVTITVSAILLVYVVAWFTYMVERNAPSATIRSWPDSLWWSVVTITTVGYGNYYPVTVMGRLLGSVLMIAGLLLVGVVSASFVSYISDRIKKITVVHAHRDKEAWEEMHGGNLSVDGGDSAAPGQGKRKHHHKREEERKLEQAEEDLGVQPSQLDPGGQP